jgi:uncharacterized protein (TIRG00374 family)
MSEAVSVQRRKRLQWLAVAIILIAVLAFLTQRWYQSGFVWSEFSAVFRNLDWAWLCGAVVFALLTYVGRALRWQVLLQPLKSRAGFWNLLSATAIGFTAIVLFGRPGEIVRPYLIAIKEKVPFSSQVGAWLLERIWDLLAALLIFGFALSHVRQSGVVVGPRLQWVLTTGGYLAGLLGLLCLIFLFLVSRFSGGMRGRLLDALSFLPQHVFEKVERIVTAFTHGMGSAGQAKFIGLLAFYSLLEWVLIVGCYVCLFQASPATSPLSLTDILIFVGFASFGAVVQVPGIGGGIQVTVILVLTEMFRLSLEVASGMALLLWLTTFVVIVPLGVLLAFHEGISFRKLRKIEEQNVL